MDKNCAWCGEELEQCRGWTGQGADLMCSKNCSALYWEEMELVDQRAQEALKRIREAEAYANDVCFEEDMRRLFSGELLTDDSDDDAT